MASLWKDPRTGILMLGMRILTHLSSSVVAWATPSKSAPEQQTGRPQKMPAGAAAPVGGNGSRGEPVRRTRTEAGADTELWWSGSRLRLAAHVAAKMERRYAMTKRDAGR